jgi:hypothetical protein
VGNPLVDIEVEDVSGMLNTGNRFNEHTFKFNKEAFHRNFRIKSHQNTTSGSSVLQFKEVSDSRVII